MSSRVVPSPQTSPDPTLRHALRHVSRAFHIEFQQRIQQYRVSESEYIVLFTLRRLPGLSSAEISRWTGVSPQAGNQILTGLLGRALVQRSPSPGHRRILQASLTAEGERVIAACERQADLLEAEMCAGMDDAERHTLGRLLHVAAAGLGRPIAEPTA